MRKHIAALTALLFGAAGIARAQCTVNYGLSYAVYTSAYADNIQEGQGAPVPGGGSVTIGGSEQSTQICTQHLAGGDCGRYRTQYDSGTVSMTVNGILVSTSYGTGTTASSIASALAGALNSNGSSGVTASVNGATIVLASKYGRRRNELLPFCHIFYELPG